MIGLWLVSIPHRYARNTLGESLVYLAGGPFQFLIGTLETKKQIETLQTENKFQFLIGTLETAA